MGRLLPLYAFPKHVSPCLGAGDPGVCVVSGHIYNLAGDCPVVARGVIRYVNRTHTSLSHLIPFFIAQFSLLGHLRLGDTGHAWHGIYIPFLPRNSSNSQLVKTKPLLTTASGIP